MADAASSEKMPVLSPALRRASFRFDGRRAPNARVVALVSSFNHWDPAVHVLRRGPDDWWTIEVWLPPGEYAYQFLVDGVPWNDPLDDGRKANMWGGDYSLRMI
jgi:1,4-alpha-glucan branching enzyme